MNKLIILYLFLFQHLLAQNIETVFTDAIWDQWRFGQWSENTDTSYIIQDDIVYSGDKAVCFNYSIHTFDHQEDETASPNMSFYEEYFTTASSPEVVLTVNTNNQVAPFTSNHLGVNIGNWTYYYGRPYPDDAQKLRDLTQLIQPGIIRYAGGLASNRATWTRENVQYYHQGYYDTDGDGEMDVFGRRQFIGPP